MNTLRYLALCCIAAACAASMSAAAAEAPAVPIEDAIKTAQALMATRRADTADLQCFISKVEYKEQPKAPYWSIFWSGKNARACFGEIRVFNNGDALFVVGY